MLCRRQCQYTQESSRCRWSNLASPNATFHALPLPSMFYLEDNPSQRQKTFSSGFRFQSGCASLSPLDPISIRICFVGCEELRSHLSTIRSMRFPINSSLSMNGLKPSERPEKSVQAMHSLHPCSPLHSQSGNMVSSFFALLQ